MLQDCLKTRTGDESETARASLSFLGHTMCRQALRRLLGLGSKRWRRLLQCAKDKTEAPMDGRSLSRKHAHPDGDKSMNRQLCLEFLAELYETLSEPMPEVKGRLRCPKLQAFHRRPGKRPKRPQAFPGSSSQQMDDNLESMRVLPPGSFTDYLSMLQTRYPERRISLKLFLTVFGRHNNRKTYAFLCRFQCL